MKNIYKALLLTCTAVLPFAGCTKNFEKYNTEPYAIPEMDPSLLIPSMINHIMYVDNGTAQQIDQMVGSLGGYYVVSSRFGGENYDTFNSSDAWNAIPYNTPFTGIYSNFFEVEKLTDATGPYYAMARILRAAAMFRVTDLYGPIPYSQVRDGLTYVEYDSNEDVYRNIIRDLEEGAAELLEFAEKYPNVKPLADSDPVYEGDYAKWARFANTIALRAALRSSDRDAAIAAADNPAGLIESNDQNAVMDVGGQSNPFQICSASWGDLRTGSSIVDYMEGYSDPRMEAYFTKSTFDGYKDKYVGMRCGEAGFEESAVQGYSMPNYAVSDPIIVYVAAETKFILAEMALRGWISGDAGTYYREGISLSMDQYGISSADAEKYMNDSESIPGDHLNDPRNSSRNYDYDRQTTVTVAWDDSLDEDQKLEKIITQKWIAIYPMGLEAWAEFRRTGYPELAPAMDNLSNGVITDNVRGMRRLRYPYTELDYNRENYLKAVSMLGGTDNESVDLFWTKKD